MPMKALHLPAGSAPYSIGDSDSRSDTGRLEGVAAREPLSYGGLHGPDGF